MNMIFVKEALGVIAIMLTFLGFIPYIYSIAQNQTKPHVFSWVIWGATTLIVFFAQMSENGGAGAWSTGISGVVTCYVAWLAYRHKGDVAITRTDWVFFITALASIPLWYLTSDPLMAVIILTAIDTVGFLPTIRKAYAKPYEEQMLLYVMMAVRNIIAMLALEHYSLTTMLFPAVMTLAIGVLLAVVMARRQLWNRW